MNTEPEKLLCYCCLGTGTHESGECITCTHGHLLGPEIDAESLVAIIQAGTGCALTEVERQIAIEFARNGDRRVPYRIWVDDHGEQKDVTPGIGYEFHGKEEADEFAQTLTRCAKGAGDSCWVYYAKPSV